MENSFAKWKSVRPSIQLMAHYYASNYTPIQLPNRNKKFIHIYAGKFLCQVDAS